MDTEFIKAIASNNLFQIIFSVATIISGLKFILLANGMRLLSFIRVYKNKKKYYNHPIFYYIEDILKVNYVKNSVLDMARKELVSDILELEIKILKRVLRMNMSYIFKKSLIKYIKNYSNFKNHTIVKLFREEYLGSREEFISRARDKLTMNNYMSQKDFNKFILIYLEYYAIYEIHLLESLETLSERKNIYATLWDILDMYNVYLQTIYKTISHKFNLMNSRVYGIEYKGHKIKPVGEKNVE